MLKQRGNIRTTIRGCECEKKDRLLMFGVDMNIPTLGPTVPVGNKASWNGGPSGWDFQSPLDTNDGFYLFKLAVELPVKFKFFTICHGSECLYF